MRECLGELFEEELVQCQDLQGVPNLHTHFSILTTISLTEPKESHTALCHEHQNGCDDIIGVIVTNVRFVNYKT